MVRLLFDRLLHTRLSSFLRRCEKLEYREYSPSITEMFKQADDCLFRKELSSKDHLQQYLPQQRKLSYSLRTLTHNLSFIPKTTPLNEQHFLTALYRNIY